MLKKAYYYVTHWEDWHWLAKYSFIFPAWCWYCLKSRSLWFFTPSNPALTFGGFLGETKQEMYKLLPESTYPRSVYIAPGLTFQDVLRRFNSSQLSYPVAVKPDAGMMGFMFRKIDSPEKLEKYHAAMQADYIIQEFVTYPLEVSVFYYRFPGQERGTITGFLRKEFLQVVGDGSSTLQELIQGYQRVLFRQEEMKLKHASHLHKILPAGEIFCLSPALNLSRGGKLVSLALEKDDQLLAVFDQLSHYTNCFYYGRYDIKCSSVEDLKKGRNFSILEYNGSGAEPHHVYGDGNSLFKACAILVHHWKILYQISKLNKGKGIPCWKFWQGIRYSWKARQHFKLLSQLDAQFEL